MITILVVGKAELTEHPVVKEVAKKMNATEAQVLIAWGVYRGYSVIPKSVQQGASISSPLSFEFFSFYAIRKLIALTRACSHPRRADRFELQAGGTEQGSL